MKSLAPPYQNVVSVAYKPSSVISGHLSRPIVTDGFKRNPESIDGPSQSLFRFLLRAGFTSRTSRQAAGELLPHLSTLTRQACGISLLHFPWGRPRRALPGALPCGARTFLTPFGARPPGSLTNGRYYTINAVPCQFFTAKQILHKTRARNARPYGHGGVMRSYFFPQHCRGAHRAPVIGICAKFRICSFTGVT